jgi:hypothetical protein
VSVRTPSNTDHRSDRWAGGVIIYALGHAGTRLIKFGKTRNMAKRIREHAYQGPNPELDIEFLAGVVGTDSDETALLNHFARFRSTTSSGSEWFEPAPEILDWLRWLRTQPNVAHSVDECSEDFLDRSDSGLWLPGAGRVAFADPNQSMFSADPWNLGEPEVTGDDFYTPHELIEAARQAFGEIDLDVASHPTAQRVVKAGTFFTIHDNALTREWFGRVWCNPPYGQWQEWAPKILRELDSDRVEELILLGPTRSVTVQSLIPLLTRATGFGVTKGRMKFWGPKANAPDDGHFLAYFGPNPHSFRCAFESALSFPAQQYALEEA